MADGSAHTAHARSQRLGAGIGIGCGLSLFLLMAHDGQLRYAGLLGLPLLLGSIAGVLGALGLWTPPTDAIPLSQTALFALPGEPTWAAPSRTLPVALVALGLLGFALGGHGLPLAIAVALAILFVSALRRPALLVFVVASAIYLPMLGAYGLWDPWETHYGEVSREILSRDDWISLWWAQDNWFWSKPILIFWTEALTWTTTGLGFHPDQNPQHTEWVLRLPIFVMAMTGLLATYAAVARVFSQRAGVLAALVLATTPYYAFLTHQAITDMPFVANMTVAMMLLALAFSADPNQTTKTLRIGRVGVSLQHALLALILFIALPQLLYLASRNITFMRGLFAWHRDTFSTGSGGNPNVPGNMGIVAETPRIRGLVFEPLMQALLWFIALCAIVWPLRSEKRAQPLYMAAFYVFCALAFMAKGIPGFALPGLVAFLCLCTSGRFSLLADGKLRVASGMLIVIVLGMPWFVAMYIRHGAAFTDRILIHDHINRLTSGVHGDNGSIQYFIWQLGYGLFPWIGLVPAALGSWLVSERGEDPATRARRELVQMFGLWFAVSFTLFSAMTTKFHHYIFPAVPPTAALIGIAIDHMLAPNTFAVTRANLLRVAAALCAPILLCLGCAGLRGDVRGIVPKSIAAAQRPQWVLDHPWPVGVCVALIVLALGLFAFASRQAERCDAPANSKLAYGTAAVGGAVLLAFVGRDLSWHIRDQPPGSERLIHLFVYNYTRAWPDYIDYRPIMFGFASAGVLCMLVCAVNALRGTAATSLLGLALAFGIYCLDVHMIDLTPHWTQAHLIQRYYAERGSPKEPLLAWQMNWKGENFYTGNRVHVFVDLDNKALMEWVGKNTGRRVYLMLEHARLDRLKQVLAPRKIETLTDMRDCNKFMLVRTTL